jgi:hypothetical protein
MSETFVSREVTELSMSVPGRRVSKLARGVRRDRLPCEVVDAGDVVRAG